MTNLAIFAKPPRAGLVKTRLIPELGADNAAKVYRYCLQHAIEIARQSRLDFRIYLSEADEDSLFAPYPIHFQSGENLGERMFNAFQELLQLNPAGAIIVGSDCLDLKVRQLKAAAQALVDHELVLLPAFDGGYALIGCRTVDTALFDRIDWSTEQVLRQTTTNADKLGYRTCLLETVHDIDTLQDMERYPELLNLVTEG